MKRIAPALLLVFCSVLAFAQDPSYAGPAKVTVKAFWDGAAKLEKSIANGGSMLDEDNLSNLKKKIADIKQKDAAYSTSSMEAKIKTFEDGIAAIKTKTSNSVKAAKESRAAGNKAGVLLGELFETSVQVSTFALPTIKEKIEAYKQKLAEVLQLDKTNCKSDLEKQLFNNRNSYKHAEKDLTELDSRCRTGANTEYSLAQYYELVFNQAYWDAAQKIYPDEADFKKAYSLATKLVDGLGTADDVKQLAAKTKEQKIKDTRLPAAAVKDAALEKTFVDAFNKYHSEEFKGTAFKAVLTSEDWSVERHEITGIVTGRIRRAVIVYKDKDGRCFLTANFFLRQEYVGSSFQGTMKSAYPVMGSQQILCENVK